MLEGRVLLEAQGVAAGYSGHPVVQNCNLRLREGEVTLLMGRNGAGKTTLVSALSGRIPIVAGQIAFEGRRVDKLPAFRRSRLGIAHVPQGREVVPRMTVRENLLLASGGLALAEEDAKMIFSAFPILSERLEQQATTLSGGEQQMVAIGRALLSHPKLILLDEPSLGLAPRVVEDVFSRIHALVRSLGLTVLLVEQQVTRVWKEGLCDYGYVLANGTVALEGPPQELEHEALKGAYLGADTG